MIYNYEPAPKYRDERPVQTFNFLIGVWDVDKAIRLTEGQEASVVNAKPWADMFLGPDLEDGKDYEKVEFGFISVNEHHALSERCDLEKPILAVLARTVNDPDGSFMVIDGWHRLWKARHLGVESLPIIVLTDEQEKACRLRGNWDKGVRQRKPAARKTKVSAK